MAVITVYAGAFVSGTWTNSANGNGAPDAVSATRNPATRRSNEVSYWGSFNFSSIPAGSTINSVTLTIRSGQSDTTAGNDLTFRPAISTTLLGTVTTHGRTTALSDTTSANQSLTLAQLQDANFRCWVNLFRESSGACTFSLDSIWYTVDYTPSGTNYSSSPADVAGITDAVSDVVDAVRSPADPAGITDSATVQAERFREPQDTAGISDAVSASLGFARSPADLAGITDTVTPVQDMQRPAADTGGITDSPTVTQDMARAPSDAAGITDSVAPVQDLARAPADSAGITDSVTAVLGGNDYVQSPADLAGATDTVTAQQDMVRPPTDTAGATDQVTVTLDRAQSPADTFGATDTASVTLDSTRAPSDALGATDTAAVTADAVRTGADSAGITDSVTAVLGRDVAAADTAGITDQVTAQQGTDRQGTDPAGISDTVTVEAHLVRGTSDTAGITDAVTAVITGSARDLLLRASALPARFAVEVERARFKAAEIVRFIVDVVRDRLEAVELPDRFTTAPLGGDMPTEIHVSKGEQRYAGGLIEETTGKDISGATYQVSLGSATSPGTGEAPGLNTAGTGNNTRRVGKLINNTVPPGRYWVWVHIGDTPENVLVRAEEIIVK